MDDTGLIQFYLPFFTDENETEAFIKQCEAKEERSKKMINLLAWLVDIADKIGEVKPGRPSLQIVFLLTCAESNSKIKEIYTEEFKSREFTHKFFESIKEEDKQLILENITESNLLNTDISFEDIIDILYNIRCETIHEGIYFHFCFSNNEEFKTNRVKKGKTPNNKIEIGIQVGLTYKQFRDVIIRTGINQIKSIL